MMRSRIHGLVVLTLVGAGVGIGIGCSGESGEYIGPVPDVPNGGNLPPDHGGSKTDASTPKPSTDAGDTGDADTGPVDAGTDSGEPDDPFPAKTKKIKDLTGLKTSSGQFAVGGTDLGIPVRQPNGKIAYIFGDTFERDDVGGEDWRSPVLLRSEPGNPKGTGIIFNGAAGGTHAKQILDYKHNHKNPDYSTWLPSDAITIGNRMYLHFMVNNGLGNVLWSQIAYSDDNGENWKLSETARWEGNEDNSLRQMWTWERGTDGYVYALSTKFDRHQAPILYKVPEDKLLDKSAYIPWGYKDDKWDWGNPPTIVLPGKFGEMCLRRIQSKWVLSWFNASDYNITIKVFDSPTSNLHTATTYTPILGSAWGAENDTHVAQLYGGYIHPDSTLHNMTLIVSQWNTTWNGPNPKPYGQKDWPYHAMQFLTGVN